MAKNYSISIDVSANKFLIELQEKTNSKSFVEVIKKSLAVYDFMVTAQIENRDIFMIDENGEKEKVIFI